MYLYNSQKIDCKYSFSKFYKKIISTNRHFTKTDREGDEKRAPKKMTFNGMRAFSPEWHLMTAQSNDCLMRGALPFSECSERLPFSECSKRLPFSDQRERMSFCCANKKNGVRIVTNSVFLRHSVFARGKPRNSLEILSHKRRIWEVQIEGNLLNTHIGIFQ